MNGSVYTRLAREGIRKNRKLYLPFIITASFMIMVTYILGYLSSDECLALIPEGRRTTGAMMDLGMWVVVAFSLIFLYYTYSFIIRRRQKEFGLYNVLGMDKKNISRIIVRETVMYSLISLAAGLFAGVLFSKLFELVLVKVSGGEVTYTLRILPGTMLRTALLFAAIFLIICIIVTVRTGISGAADLMNSERAGEKPPKAAFLPAAAGAVILAAAYFLAVTVNIEYPVEALRRFAIAVIMVVVSTYLIMMAGSVFLCRALQKNKKYYYKKKHFVSVSSMAYRMKRNGAGLASICIIATVVLVTVSTTTCLLFGARDTVYRMYPGDIDMYVWINMDRAEEADLSGVRRAVAGIIEEKGGTPETVCDAEYGRFTGTLSGTQLEYTNGGSADGMENTNVYILSQKEYGRITGEDISLGEDEAVLISPDPLPEGDTFRIDDDISLKIKEFEGKEPELKDTYADDGGILYIVVRDPSVTFAPFLSEDDYRHIDYVWHYAADTGIPSEKLIDLGEDQELYNRILSETYGTPEINYGFSIAFREVELQAVRAAYGGLFFMGLILSGVFLVAAVLIIYYKQLSEGYEDRARFDIMQKVGMTKADIRKSVNSQLLTVFFLPLIMAGMHLLFAFPMIRKLLTLFEIYNTGLFAMTTVISYIIFAAFYAAVYKLTSNTYYRIVS